jgi:nitrogen fixation NifU-like protein
MDGPDKNAIDSKQKLYSKVLIDHFRNPRNYGSLPSPDVTQEIFNPLCGDRIRIELEIRDGRIEAARFVGDGCAISIAAASMLTEMSIGAEIDHLVSNDQLLSSLKSDIKPSRIRCALLSLEALCSGVESYKQQAAGR